MPHTASSTSAKKRSTLARQIDTALTVKKSAGQPFYADLPDHGGDQSDPRRSTDLLDTEEAAAYLRLPAETLETWRCRRRGPSYLKAGHRVLYRRADLDHWLERGRVEMPA